MSDVTCTCRDLNKLHPRVKALALELIAKGKAEGLDILITETYRSQARQEYLYAQGRTRPGSIVTNVRQVGYHGYGLAFDFCQNVRGREYEEWFMNRVGRLAQSIGLDWGGSWTSFVDKPHCQFTFGLSLNQLRSGIKPPEGDDILADVKTIKIALNDVKKDVESVLINGYNYVKLRDLEDSKIIVGYDNKNKIPTVTVKN